MGRMGKVVRIMLVNFLPLFVGYDTGSDCGGAVVIFNCGAIDG